MKTHGSRSFQMPNGFTVIELMITMVMAGIIVAALYAAYNVQNKSYLNQGQVVEMQQNLRAAMEFMSKEIRMAGYDLTGSAGAEISTATVSRFSFTADLDDNGELDDGGSPPVADDNEKITFCLTVTGADDTDGGVGSADGCDDDGLFNGVVNTGEVNSTSIRRNLDNLTGSGGTAIADDIIALEFFYILTDGTGTTSPASGDLDKIQTVKISILTSSRLRDPKYTDNNTYVTAAGTQWTFTGGSPTWANINNANFRHRLLVSSVNVRNQGL